MSTDILLVEDKASLRQMLRRALDRVGYTIDEAPDGRRAVELIRQRPFRLVITDLRLPYLDGIDVLKAQKQRDPSVPVLVMTGADTAQEAGRAMALGAMDVVAKPVDIAGLLSRVRQGLESVPAAPPRETSERGESEPEAAGESEPEARIEEADPEADAAPTMDLSGSLRDVTRRATRAAETAKLRQALEASRWDRGRAARSLGISSRTLASKIRQYGLKPPGQAPTRPEAPEESQS